MSIMALYAVPHPPLIVPAVGKGREKAIQNTIDGYEAVASDIASLAPETVIVVSPHASCFADYIHVSPGGGARGSLARFGAREAYEVTYDEALTREISALCARDNIPAGTRGRTDPELDHGTLVPLHFIRARFPDCMYLRIGVSFLPRETHYRFGMLLNEAVESLGRRAVLVASGDLSHKLAEDGPYGFAPEGPKLDRALTDILRTGDFGGLLALDETLVRGGAECGFAGLCMLAGALDGRAVRPTFYSYEGPFGVGYAVAALHAGDFDPARRFLERAGRDDAEDAHVALARASLERYVRTGKRLSVPDGLPDELTKRRAGAFVSIKKHGELRGCIGTISPVKDSLAEEIIDNAVSSGTRDPRFPPVGPDELGELTYSVDVLSPAEPVRDKSELDCRRYGVIVKYKGRRGLLLPNLEGVDSVDEQLMIACRKAGIGMQEPYAVERFEVVRHT